jgi:hypothetical protein
VEQRGEPFPDLGGGLDDGRIGEDDLQDVAETLQNAYQALERARAQIRPSPGAPAPPTKKRRATS